MRGIKLVLEKKVEAWPTRAAILLAPVRLYASHPAVQFSVMMCCLYLIGRWTNPEFWRLSLYNLL